jgi:dTDP-L-rhamnose 4-epimerase
VLASSMVVYGEGRYACAEHGVVQPGPRAVADLDAARFEPPCPHCGRALEPRAVPEDAPLDPRNVYAATKLQQELLCRAFARETGVPVTALRYHNVYGPRMPRDTPYAGVASIFRSALEADRAPRVFEDGGQRRDFVHVRDVAQANVLALTGDEAVPGAFNVCSGTPRTVGDLAAALADAAGPAAPRPEVTGEYRLGDVRHVFADATRARDALGFEAAVPFAEGVAEFARAQLR